LKGIPASKEAGIFALDKRWKDRRQKMERQETKDGKTKKERPETQDGGVC